MDLGSATCDARAAAEAFMPAGLAREAPETLCAKLARGHYENFAVGSILLPRELRRHVHNVYAYCRVCDDLADETGDPELSLRLLDWWAEELHLCFDGAPRHPLFCALKETVDRFSLPVEPFEDLISAFVQDQHVTRYASFENLLGYCKRSANPVGRLFLGLLGCNDNDRRQLSDFTCTALQLANVWQDLSNDYARGRVYIPLEDMDRFGYSEAELRNGIVNASFVRLMRFEITRTREFFERGAPLACQIHGAAAADVELFTRCGTALLDSIEHNGYDVLKQRVTVTKARKLGLMAAWMLGRGRGSGDRGRKG